MGTMEVRAAVACLAEASEQLVRALCREPRRGRCQDSARYGADDSGRLIGLPLQLPSSANVLLRAPEDTAVTPAAHFYLCFNVLTFHSDALL
ncbi:hypothetical protein AAFF_G00208680 [Aldrovandia affinis]|uniref:Uncharacterized protein n=1 Tax=Aldrovandia affinis TaxID=143900 RepID=A0AAD7RHB1_9TELE|nr:hypothetical protein AAFF_G00208680 [Aldrovandia affinis]